MMQRSVLDLEESKMKELGPALKPAHGYAVDETA